MDAFLPMVTLVGAVKEISPHHHISALIGQEYIVLTLETASLFRELKRI